MEYQNLPFLKPRSTNFKTDYAEATKWGTPIEKGVVLTEEFLIKYEEEIKEFCSLITVYPDIFLDIITPSYSNFTLFFYQRIFLRAIMRFKELYITAPRAFSKTFITILGLILQCIFLPGTKRFICAPGKGQSAQIAKEKIYELYDRWPLLKNEVKITGNTNSAKDMPGNFGKDYVELTFKNRSIFNVVAPLDSTRGGRRHGGLIDEIRKILLKNYTILDEISLNI